MSLTQGRSNPWSTGLTRRRLAAGEARRGGGVQDPCSGDQMGGGGHLRVAGNEPPRLVAVVELGVAGNITGDELCGCWSSGEVEPEATGHGEARGVVLRVPAGAVSVLDAVVWPVGGRSHVGDELGGGGCA